MTDIENFQKLDIRTGTIVSAVLNEKARKPAYIITIDFGSNIGIKTSSAQLTKNYTPESLVGRQIVAVVNFPSMRIAGVKSEVLILGSLAAEDHGDVILLQPEQVRENGLSIG